MKGAPGMRGDADPCHPVEICFIAFLAAEGRSYRNIGMCLGRDANTVRKWAKKLGFSSRDKRAN